MHCTHPMEVRSFNPINRKPINTGMNHGMEPIVLHHELHAVQRRYEQESVLEVRRRAIARWLKQLPVPENERTKTMWMEDVRSFEEFEEATMDEEEKKMCPESMAPIRAYPTSAEMYKDGQPSSFRDKWTADGDDSVIVHEVPDQPLKLLQEVFSSGSLPSDGWSTDETSPKEDTAYVGSSTGSRKETSKSLFHLKYKIRSPTFDPPISQTIASQSPKNVRSFAVDDAKSEVSRAKMPEGEWWLPNIFFAGLLTCTNEQSTVIPTPSHKDVMTEDEKMKTTGEVSAQSERTMRRLRLRRSIDRRRSLPKKPSPFRLRSRMMREKKRRSRDVECALEYPFKMKSMIPDGDRTPHPLAPPEIRTMEYLPPSSVADLSDFGCYAESPNGRDIDQMGHCQTWMIEKLLWILGGRPRQ